MEYPAIAIEREQSESAEGAGAGERPGAGSVGEDGNGDRGSEDSSGDRSEVTNGVAGGPVGVGAQARVLPCVDEEAVEAADGGEEDGVRQQQQAEFWMARDGGDEDGGGKKMPTAISLGRRLPRRMRAWMSRNQAKSSEPRRA